MMIFELLQCSPMQVMIFYGILMIIMIISFLLDRYIDRKDFKKFVHDYYNGTLNYGRSRLLK